jgi:hypothetical protein
MRSRTLSAGTGVCVPEVTLAAPTHTITTIHAVPLLTVDVAKSIVVQRDITVGEGKGNARK